MFTIWEKAFFVGIAILGICLAYNLKLEAVGKPSEIHLVPSNTPKML